MDSQKDLRKARGYIFSRKDKSTFSCHNCGASMGLPWFLKTVNPGLADEYRMEKFGAPTKQPVVEDTLFKTGCVTKTIKLPLVRFLSQDHQARQYCNERHIPMDAEIYHCKDFPAWASSNFEQLAKWKKAHTHSRLIIPIYNKEGDLIGLSARAYGNEAPKYCNTNLTEEPMIFGIDKLDDRQQFVCEGPIDSLMLDNAVAVMTGSLKKAEPYVNDQAIYIPDHQPRNLEIVKLAKQLVEQGKRVCIWPDYWAYKDLNDAVISGMKREEVQQFVIQHSVQGLRAMTEFSRWKKV